MSKETITLTCEDKKIEVPLEVLKKSIILKNMIEDTSQDGEINIPNINFKTLQLVIKYCEEYKDKTHSEIKQPLEGKDLLANGATEWDVKFIDSIDKMDDLIDLIVAANFLDIEGLLALGCAKIASVIKGKGV